MTNIVRVPLFYIPLKAIILIINECLMLVQFEMKKWRSHTCVYHKHTHGSLHFNFSSFFFQVILDQISFVGINIIRPKNQN